MVCSDEQSCQEVLLNVEFGPYQFLSSFFKDLFPGTTKVLLKSYSGCEISMKFLFWQVKHLRSKYRVLDIEVDGGVGIPTIEAAAQVIYDTVPALMFIQCNYWPKRLT